MLKFVGTTNQLLKKAVMLEKIANWASQLVITVADLWILRNSLNCNSHSAVVFRTNRKFLEFLRNRSSSSMHHQLMQPLLWLKLRLWCGGTVLAPLSRACHLQSARIFARIVNCDFLEMLEPLQKFVKYFV